MLQGGVRDANETTDYTDATDVGLGSARGSRADFRGLAAAKDAKQRPGFQTMFNDESTRMASAPLNRYIVKTDCESNQGSRR